MDLLMGFCLQVLQGLDEVNAQIHPWNPPLSMFALMALEDFSEGKITKKTLAPGVAPKKISGSEICKFFRTFR